MRTRATAHREPGLPGDAKNDKRYAQADERICDLRPECQGRCGRDYGDADRECCRFWTTTTAFIAASGPLGEVWAGGGSRRVGLKAMDGLPRSERDVDASIGKPGWWLRRPGGGAGS